ncbi:hypothetical protein L1987_82612 [Smallanthus sonchifolius]|uniref:Uncharacterized protein n=1 Tax=Smallanthus sonchifolius TaxID=185202 RepID=A0ACB8YBH5_9ASTR|nr:hypothetical protein L1987_82612 [Smallanthus sonchifolius]
MIQDTVKRLLYRVKDEQNHTNRVLPSIYMVPGTLRDLSPNSFKPRVVSIGPLHRGDKNVQAFEERKATYLFDLIRHTKCAQEVILESCVQKVYASMEKIKASYVWTKTYGDAEIAEMMVMDACFILGFNYQVLLSLEESFYREMLLFKNVMHDLVLLENQIPFFILDEIFQCTILKFIPHASLVKLMYPVLTYLKLFKADIKTDHISIDTTHHILSLLHQCYKPQDCIKPSYPRSGIHSAVDLDRAWVNFKPNQNPTSIWVMEMEVRLSRFQRFFGSWTKPTLTMPILIVGDFTESILRNLIAYEQSCETRNHITSYASIMNMLVDNQEDVSKLVGSGVLVNYMGSNEEAASMINNIGKNVTGVHSFYEEQCKTLDKYCNSYWPKNIARLRRTYFNSPWNMIALLAGIVLFVLTVVQTIFTIKSPGSSK